MSPRAFQTVLVAPMAPKERKDLESRVLAAAFKQSFQRGDTEGANLAHKQIYLLLKAGEDESAAETNVDAAETADTSDRADNGAFQEPVASETVQADDRAGTREINLNNADYAKLEVEAMEKLTAKAKAKSTRENVSVGAGAAATASKLPAQSPAGDSAAHAPDRQTTQDQEIPKANSYVLLNVEPGASFREIHISFLRMVRRLLFEFNQAPKKKRRAMIRDLQQISIAHDILSDPLTRTDYDIRFLGLKSPVAGTTEGVTESGGVLFKVGELLESAGLLEPTELEIAADMHKAMPEMLFGTFLVKQGFITEGDLEQAVLGQELVKDALIKLDVFKQAMSGWLTSQTPIRDYLVAENIISKEDMDRIVSKNLQEIQVQKVAQSQQPVRSGPASKIQAVSSGPMINTEEAAKRMISKGHAIPGWKDQLDWSQPEEEEIAKFEHAVRQEKEYARPDIEDIGSGAAQKSGKKSLRSLMDGIHAPEGSEAPKAKTRKTIADLMGPLGDEEFNKPTVDEISNLSQLLQPEELQVIEALESIDNLAIANDVVRIKDAMSDTSESIKRPLPPQAEKYSDITADKPMPEVAAPAVSIRTWMEEESPLGFGFEEGSYDEEEDIEFSFDFGRSNEDDESVPTARFVEDTTVSENIDNPFDHLQSNEDSLEDDLDAAYGRTSAPETVPSSESEFPQEQEELWEYVEDANHDEQAQDTEQSEETAVEFVEDEEADVEEMVEVEVLVESEEDEDRDPTGMKTREFEIELAAEEELEQITGTKSGWSIEPFRAPVAPPIEDLESEGSSYVEPKEDLETTRERGTNLEETAAISADLAKRAVAEAQSKAQRETEEMQENVEELGFSVHIHQADEDSTVEDLDPIVITQENEQPNIEASERSSPSHEAADPQAATSPPGNEETSEWQLVYKISGSLADALMSDDDDEADMSNLAPKLDDVNVFVTPSQFSGRPITKEWDRVEEKGETKEHED